MSGLFPLKAGYSPDGSEKEHIDLVGVEVEHDASHLTRLSPEELVLEKKLKRKIDFRIMPLVILVYLMNYIDRNNYAAARLQGLEQDLHLVGNQYQVGLSILFVGYVRLHRTRHSITVPLTCLFRRFSCKSRPMPF